MQLYCKETCKTPLGVFRAGKQYDIDVKKLEPKTKGCEWHAFFAEKVPPPKELEVDVRLLGQSGKLAAGHRPGKPVETLLDLS